MHWVDWLMWIRGCMVCVVGKMAQDVGIVWKFLWCDSRLVWLVLEGSIPTWLIFRSGTFL